MLPTPATPPVPWRGRVGGRRPRRRWPRWKGAHRGKRSLALLRYFSPIYGPIPACKGIVVAVWSGCAHICDFSWRIRRPPSLAGYARFPVLHVLAMLEGGLERALHMHIAKQRMMLDGALQSHIAATVPGLAAAIARECMAAWTREALAKRRDRQGGGHSA